MRSADFYLLRCLFPTNIIGTVGGVVSQEQRERRYRCLVRIVLLFLIFDLKSRFRSGGNCVRDRSKKYEEK